MDLELLVTAFGLGIASGYFAATALDRFAIWRRAWRREHPLTPWYQFWRH